MLLRKGRFNIDSPEISTVRRLMRRFWTSSSSTKEILESTFGHLADMVARSSTNKKMAPNLLWLYCTSCPYVKSSGMKQSMPDSSAWTRFASNYGQSKTALMKSFNKAFQLGSAYTLSSSKDVVFPKTVRGLYKKEWRHAGPLSHYKSSAAASYLMYDAPSFGNLMHVCAGQGCKKRRLPNPVKMF